MSRSASFERRGNASRWAAFYAVGALGVTVQLAAVWALTTGAGVNYLTSTVIGVELAVLHNFLWHERWTWADRSSHLRGSALTRLARFNIANGILSVFGNVVFTGAFVTIFGTSFLVGNALAIAACSVVNFLVADRLVFTTGTPATSTQ